MKIVDDALLAAQRRRDELARGQANIERRVREAAIHGFTTRLGQHPDADDVHVTTSCVSRVVARTYALRMALGHLEFVARVQWRAAVKNEFGAEITSPGYVLASLRLNDRHARKQPSAVGPNIEDLADLGEALEMEARRRKVTGREVTLG